MHIKSYTVRHFWNDIELSAEIDFKKGFKDLGRGIEILTDNTTVVTEVGVSEKHREAGIAEFLVDQVYESAKENEEFKFFVYSDESIKDVNRALRHRTYTKNCEMKNLYERID